MKYAMPKGISWQDHWLTNKGVNAHSVSDWVKKGPHLQLHAVCLLCKKTFSIFNQGMEHAIQHTRG